MLAFDPLRPRQRLRAYPRLNVAETIGALPSKTLFAFHRELAAQPPPRPLPDP